MSNPLPFYTGEFVELNTPNAPSQHGRKGIVSEITWEDVKGEWLWSPMIREYKISVQVKNDDRFVTYVVKPNQLLRAINDPAFEKFKSGFLAETEEAAKHQVAKDLKEQEDIANETNEDIRIHKTGFNDEFNAGYDTGWKDAIAHVLKIFNQHGFGLNNKDI